MNNELLNTYNKTHEFFKAIELLGEISVNQVVRNALNKYQKGYLTLEEAVKEATE